jgi:23S rRNA-/tRNA-specific pseudouridylate synthase
MPDSVEFLQYNYNVISLIMRFLHRLDYATSGAICVALTKLGARRGHRAFEKHYVTKHYIALVRSFSSSSSLLTCNSS